ncbi:titin-like [Astyanax mexicanus]|uniref:Titin-like n=1 Tax=Astyanax mexicanus TaxID=7994 RepID=A0A8T2MJF4_ASTMX|nr:titin-like [Astyanax mexicanus]
MERKLINLGRAKKKLRYFQPEEKAPCSIKIKDVFSLHDLDDIFDDLDSESGTPQLSPLPQSRVEVDQVRGKKSPALKLTSPFGAEEPEVLAPENCIQEDHLNDKGSPFEEIAPIKTSSPIDRIQVEDEAADAERPETSPILFGVEDEPVQGDVSKPSSTQKSKNIKEFYQDESLVSPPVRIEFVKPATEDVSVSCMPLLSTTAASKGCQTISPETKEESQTDGDLNILPFTAEVRIDPPQSLSKEQPIIQSTRVPDKKSDAEVKQSSFQQKLKNAFKPKAALKPEVRTQQARAPSPVELDDDFMILEDDAPILFTIPKRTKAKPPAEGDVEKPDGSQKSSQNEPDPIKKNEDKYKHGDETDAAKTKKTKAKRGKVHSVSEKDTVAQVTPEETPDPLPEVAEVCEPSPVPEASQEADLPGKQSTKRKTSKSENLGKEDGKDERVKRRVEKPASKIKKPDNITDDTNNRHEEPATKVKKKPRKAKSTVKVGGSESEEQHLATPNEEGNGNPTMANKEMPEGLEPVHNLLNDPESPLEFTEQPDVQSTTTVKNASKQTATKPGPFKKPIKVKKLEKTKKDAKIKELPVREEGPGTSKRKRKPPGEWWLNSESQNNDNTQQQEVAVQQSLRELKPNKKMKKALQISANPAEGQESQSESNNSVTVQKVPRKNKKSDSAGDQKNPKTAGGRRKTKSTAPARRKAQEKASAPVAEEEVAVDENVEQPCPAACSPLPRRKSLTPGGKRVFENIYTRDSHSGSAQNCPPSALNPSESLPGKRQRKPTSNWWEVPHSQGSVESSRSPLNRSPQKTKPQMAPPCSAFDSVPNVGRSQKTAVVNAQKRNKLNLVQTPRTVKRSLAAFDAILASGDPWPLSVKAQESRQKGRRNLLHSLDDQSEQSSENIPSDQQHATFDVCTSGVTVEPFAASRRASTRLSAGSNRASEYDTAFKSGPSSMIELERFEEHEDCDLPKYSMIPDMPHVPRVLSDCDFCGPPLQPIVLESDDWDNLCLWFAHLWPSAPKDGQVFSIISPDDFHWHSHGGRAMGHMVDFQSNNFSNGKILLGSYMKKPLQEDLHAVTVFNVVSSSVRLEIDGIKTVYNSGQAFMTPCGQSYSIHNVCREPAVLWYTRMLQNQTNLQSKQVEEGVGHNVKKQKKGKKV